MVQTQERKCFPQKEEVRKENGVWIFGSICKFSMLFLFLSPPAWCPPSSKQWIFSQLEDPFILKSIKRGLGKLIPLQFSDETQLQLSSFSANVHKNSESISEKCRGIELKSLSSSSSNKNTKPRLEETFCLYSLSLFYPVQPHMAGLISPSGWVTPLIKIKTCEELLRHCYCCFIIWEIYYCFISTPSTAINAQGATLLAAAVNTIV
ncbi:hypothetical protein SADUNF_Sadunf02G0064700 [Salix dunnii]|uniref:Uncharacterized protein n=1 Tax=Salix dunnii TaxID=1413687 RepID=A0A835N6G2_9ROSI|nr:hypothetical protein SADUNF_Sadunf02G0064700 [Salix dunnii]